MTLAYDQKIKIIDALDISFLAFICLAYADVKYEDGLRSELTHFMTDYLGDEYWEDLLLNNGKLTRDLIANYFKKVETKLTYGK